MKLSKLRSFKIKRKTKRPASKRRMTLILNPMDSPADTVKEVADELVAADRSIGEFMTSWINSIKSLPPIPPQPEAIPKKGTQEYKIWKYKLRKKIKGMGLNPRKTTIFTNVYPTNVGEVSKVSKDLAEKNSSEAIEMRFRYEGELLNQEN